MRAIAREVGVSRNTVRRYLRDGDTDLSLDFRGFQSLCADEFDDEVGPLILSDML